MITVDAVEIERQFAALLAKVEQQGETILICRGGKPVAELKGSPGFNADRLAPHPELGKIVLNYDPTETATEEDWPGADR